MNIGYRFNISPTIGSWRIIQIRAWEAKAYLGMQTHVSWLENQYYSPASQDTQPAIFNRRVYWLIYFSESKPTKYNMLQICFICCCQSTLGKLLNVLLFYRLSILFPSKSYFNSLLMLFKNASLATSLLTAEDRENIWGNERHEFCEYNHCFCFNVVH